MAFTTEAIARGAATRAARSAARAAQAETLAPGVTIRLDSPPGVGWVLERAGHPNRYLRDRGEAVAHYAALAGKEQA